MDLERSISHEPSEIDLSAEEKVEQGDWDLEDFKAEGHLVPPAELEHEELPDDAV